MTHLTSQTNTVYVNDGTALFSDRSAASGLGPSSFAYTGFGAAWVDFDNDGWLDVLAVNGTVQDVGQNPGAPFPVCSAQPVVSAISPTVGSRR